MVRHSLIVLVALAMMAVTPVTSVADALEDFSKLSNDAKREYVLGVFRGHFDATRNISYDVQTSLFSHRNEDGEPGEVVQELPYRRFQVWQMGDSYRIATDMHVLQKLPAENIVVSNFDAAAGISRAMIKKAVGSDPGRARIDVTHDPLIRDNRFRLFFYGNDFERSDFLFRSVIERWNEWQFSETERGLIELRMGWRTEWAFHGDGSRILLLDSNRGFFPVSGKASYSDSSGEIQLWRRESFEVEDLKKVAGIWVPVKLSETISSSSLPATIAVYHHKVVGISIGTVTREDLPVRFEKGMRVLDAIKGIDYTSDGAGNPINSSK